jgi:ATP-binding cassette subfamily F protein 3
MLTVSQVSKAFAGRTLFEDVSLQVNRGDRIGLVGPNGAGKSTLFSLLLGEASPDTGRVSLEKSATVGFLPQESAPAGDETVLELATAINPELAKAKQLIKRHEAGDGDDERLTMRRSPLSMSTAAGSLSRKAKKILAGSPFARAISIGRRGR